MGSRVLSPSQLPMLPIDRIADLLRKQGPLDVLHKLFSEQEHDYDMQGKVHQTFDVEAWMQKNGQSILSEMTNPDESHPVWGPINAAEIFRARRLLPPSVIAEAEFRAADVFIWSLGEPEKSYSTKLGGVPHFSRSMAWPRYGDGSPMPFLAQVNFMDSQDIVSTSFDLLLVFGGRIGELSREFELRCVTVSDADDIIALNDVPCNQSFLSCYGTIWRTSNASKGLASDPTLMNGVQLFRKNMFVNVWGTQISTDPFSFMDHGTQEPDLAPICSISFCGPGHTVYPYLNHPAKLVFSNNELDDYHLYEKIFSPLGEDCADGETLIIGRRRDDTLGFEVTLG